MARSPRRSESDTSPQKEVTFTNRRIEVHMGVTINLGDYQSQKIGLGFSGDIGDGEDLESCYDSILTWVENKLAIEAELVETAKPVLAKIRKAIKR